MQRNRPGRDVEKERFWRSAVRGQEGSGQSIRAYCSGNGLTEASFYAWRRELRRRGRSQAAKRTRRPDAGQAAFLPVRIAPSALSVSLSPIECLLPGGVVLRLPAEMEPAAIAAVVTSWERSRC